MKKILGILAAILILAVAVLAGWYYGRQQLPQPNEDEGSFLETRAPIKQQDEMVRKEGFSILLPQGWNEIGAPPGVSLMAVHTAEEITDPAAQKINFRSNFAVSFDQKQGLSEDEYFEKVKNQILTVVPEITFGNESILEINGDPAQAIEAETVTQGIQAKVLIVVIQGQADDVWVLTFNTLQAEWDHNTPLFTRIAQSFSQT